jgi:alpha-tubulin suppressor-like RCC1 family protein
MGLLMVTRLSASLSRILAAAALTVLGLAAVLQVVTAVPATAAAPGSTVGIFAWGDNSSGELGNGSTTNSSTPAPVSLPSGVVPIAIAGGGGNGDPQPSQFTGYAIGSDGHVYAWGDDSRGALGNGNTTDSTTPVVVSLPSGITPTAITASQGTGYAIGSDGHVYAWGDNTYGTLGDGSAVAFSDTPVVVALPTGVTPVAIAGGFETGYAIGSDGKLYAWGDNFYGELGDGNGPDSSTPVLVSLPAGVTAEAIAGGGGFALAIGSDGQLYSWGLNSNGALGDGGTTNSSTPVVVSLPSSVTPTAIAGGVATGYAIGSDGHLYAWGANGTGQLGNDSTTDSPTPVLVSLPSGVTPHAVAAGAGTGVDGSAGVAYAIGSDDHLYAWGNNVDGQLGDGTNTNASTPVLVSLPPGSTPQELAQEPGSASGYAIVNAPNVAPTISAQPGGQTVTAGQDATFTAAASGFPAPTVQWQLSTDHGASFAPVTGATSDTLTVAATTTSENGNVYEAVFTNVAGTATTDPATLTVSPPVAPAITAQPSNQTVSPGQTAVFTAAASGTPTPTVQWQVSVDGGTTWSDIEGNGTSNSATLSGTVYGAFENGWQVRAVFTNVAGTATSDPATLTVS